MRLDGRRQSSNVDVLQAVGPDSFNHGTSAQRSKWLKKGITTGTLEGGDTFSLNYAAL